MSCPACRKLASSSWPIRQTCLHNCSSEHMHAVLQDACVAQLASVTVQIVDLGGGQLLSVPAAALSQIATPAVGNLQVTATQVGHLVQAAKRQIQGLHCSRQPGTPICRMTVCRHGWTGLAHCIACCRQPGQCRLCLSARNLMKLCGRHETHAVLHEKLQQCTLKGRRASCCWQAT